MVKKSMRSPIRANRGMDIKNKMPRWRFLGAWLLSSIICEIEVG